MISLEGEYQHYYKKNLRTQSNDIALIENNNDE